MPRRRSQTGFTGILPPELVERCLEFLPFEEVHTNAKQVSKAMRSAARRCLTRGRWRPLKYVVENAIVTNALERPSSAAETATFRAAWAVDPRQVLLEFILLWNNKRESCLEGDSTILTDTFWNWDRGNTLAGVVGVFKPSVARFLALVEPSIDGLGRLTMALESVEHHLETRGRGRYRAEMPITLLRLWMERLGDFALLGDYHREITLDELLNPESLVGSGLESWAEPGDMVSFIDWLRDWTDADVHLMNEAAEALSSQWKDRCKAGAFVAAAASKVEQWFIDYGPDY